jgi:hypothetical protein
MISGFFTSSPWRGAFLYVSMGVCVLIYAVLDHRTHNNSTFNQKDH